MHALERLNPLLALFFRCPGCDGEPEASTFPLCSPCSLSLTPVDAKSWCSCGNPSCGGSPCSEPWLKRSGVASSRALYILCPSSYRILKKWKTSKGHLWTRAVFAPEKIKSLLKELPSIEALIPIPQEDRRSWDLSGGPAYLLALAIQKQIGVPILPHLRLPEGISRRHQAEKQARQRYESPPQFCIADPMMPPPKRVLLVDDFLITGTTVDRAVRMLRAWGVEEVHLALLGIRLSQTMGESEEAVDAR